MTALSEAIKEKRALEATLNQYLTEFNERTGLEVLHIECGRTDVTGHGDAHRRYVYDVRCRIEVEQ